MQKRKANERAYGYEEVPLFSQISLLEWVLQRLLKINKDHTVKDDHSPGDRSLAANEDVVCYLFKSAGLI